MTKFCRDCKHMMPAIHVLGRDQIRLAKCAKDFKADAVTGVVEYSHCSVARISVFEGCGVQGNFWEPVENVVATQTPKKPGFWSKLFGREV
jgi:hypothetical protein